MSVSYARQLDTDDGGPQVICALLPLFGGLTDPRSPRGIRHELASVLTITVLAVLAGARNFREAGDRAAELPCDLLIAAGARIHPATGVPQAPSSATIGRIVAEVDAGHADARVGAWLAKCVAAHRTRRGGQQPDLPEGADWLDGLAIDGKVIRNSAAPGGVNVKLFSALTHREQVVIAQVPVPEQTTEVTCVPSLLDSVDLANRIVTADAAHAQDTTADYLVRIRNADLTCDLTFCGLLWTIVASRCWVLPTGGCGLTCLFREPGGRPEPARVGFGAPAGWVSFGWRLRNPRRTRAGHGHTHDRTTGPPQSRRPAVTTR